MILLSNWQCLDRRTLLVAAAVFIFTPFYLFNAASYHSHMLAALLIVLLCNFCIAYQRYQKPVALVGAGVMLGLIGVTRYFTLIPLLPALCFWILAERRHNRFQMLALVVLAGIPFLWFLMWYHHILTGSPFRTIYSLITEPVATLSIALSDIRNGLALTLSRQVELIVWTSPMFVTIYYLCLVSKISSRSLAFYDLIFPSFIVCYVFFAELGGNRYGPRYYFDAFPIMFATILTSAPSTLALSRTLLGRPFIFHSLLAFIAYFLVSLPIAFNEFQEQVWSRQEPYRLAESYKLNNAIVIVRRSIRDGMPAADLARNSGFLESKVLFARAESSPQELAEHFPLRSIWLYERYDREKPGTLTQVAAGKGTESH